jgi:hypothetical protein
MHTEGCRGQDAIISVVTRLQTGRQRDCDSIPVRSKKCFSSLTSPDRVWGPLSVLLNYFPEDKSSQAVNQPVALMSAEVKIEWG